MAQKNELDGLFYSLLVAVIVAIFLPLIVIYLLYQLGVLSLKAIQRLKLKSKNLEKLPDWMKAEMEAQKMKTIRDYKKRKNIRL